MAEIKSTIDLIMERTRHLTMSEQDRREQALSEFRVSLGRIVQKYLEREIDLDRFQEEYGRIEDSSSPSRKATAAMEIGKRIDPSQNNDVLLELLRIGLGINISGLKTILEKTRRIIVSTREEARTNAAVTLSRVGISGNAVVPDFETPDLLMRVDQICRKAGAEISDELARLSPGK